MINENKMPSERTNFDVKDYIIPTKDTECRFLKKTFSKN